MLQGYSLTWALHKSYIDPYPWLVYLKHSLIYSRSRICFWNLSNVSTKFEWNLLVVKNSQLTISAMMGFATISLGKKGLNLLSSRTGPHPNPSSRRGFQGLCLHSAVVCEEIDLTNHWSQHANIVKLVGGLEHEFNFSIYWECHHPNWRTHIFQRGRSTTNQKKVEIIQVQVRSCCRTSHRCPAPLPSHQSSPGELIGFYTRCCLHIEAICIPHLACGGFPFTVADIYIYVYIYIGIPQFFWWKGRLWRLLVGFEPTFFFEKSNLEVKVEVDIGWLERFFLPTRNEMPHTVDSFCSSLKWMHHSFEWDEHWDDTPNQFRSGKCPKLFFDPRKKIGGCWNGQKNAAPSPSGFAIFFIFWLGKSTVDSTFFRGDWANLGAICGDLILPGECNMCWTLNSALQAVKVQ